MITRIALFIGTVRPGAEDQMRRYVDDELAPLWRHPPGFAGLTAQRPCAFCGTSSFHLERSKGSGDPNGQTIPLRLCRSITKPDCGLLAYGL